MSDPRIYHRVGPVAPEGRQIYDDIRRRDLGLTSAFNSEISTVNGEITTLDGTVTTLEALVNALTVTPVSIGTSTEDVAFTIPTSPGVDISFLSVVPVAPKPFAIIPQGQIYEYNRLDCDHEIAWYETTSGSPVLIETIIPDSNIPYHTTALFYQTVVANTATTTRTFELNVTKTAGGALNADWNGHSKAFQWTVG